MYYRKPLTQIIVAKTIVAKTIVALISSASDTIWNTTGGVALGPFAQLPGLRVYGVGT